MKLSKLGWINFAAHIGIERKLLEKETILYWHLSWKPLEYVNPLGRPNWNQVSPGGMGESSFARWADCWSHAMHLAAVSWPWNFSGDDDPNSIHGRSWDAKSRCVRDLRNLGGSESQMVQWLSRKHWHPVEPWKVMIPELLREELDCNQDWLFLIRGLERSQGLKSLPLNNIFKDHLKSTLAWAKKNQHVLVALANIMRTYIWNRPKLWCVSRNLLEIFYFFLTINIICHCTCTHTISLDICCQTRWGSTIAYSWSHQS